jgi:hypothetical protein
MSKTAFTILVLLFISLNIFAQRATNTDPETAKIVTSDIDLFWKAFDKAAPGNGPAVFRDEYLEKGSVGLQDFTKLRIGKAENLAGTVKAIPKYYEALREPSLKIASYENRIRTSFRKLKEIYPESVFPDVYFVIGILNSAGTTSNNGLLIGVDMFGKNEGAPLDRLSDWHKAVLSPTERIPYVVAHELIHYEQKFPGGKEWTLLGKVLNEGGADFVSELIAGDTINLHLHKYGNPIEKELWLEFKKEMNGTDAGNWLYQGDKAKNRPADLGYYVGYKICESYYKNAKEKKQAVKDILEINDFAKFLADSKYEQKFN